MLDNIIFKIPKDARHVQVIIQLGYDYLFPGKTLMFLVIQSNNIKGTWQFIFEVKLKCDPFLRESLLFYLIPDEPQLTWPTPNMLLQWKVTGWSASCAHCYVLTLKPT